MRFLCLSDIHGNAHALKKILREADVRGFDQLIVCGDLCYPGEGALEVWKILVKRHALCVQGVGDRALARLKPDKLQAQTEEGEFKIKRLREMKEELGELIIARLDKLPQLARLPLESGHTMLIVHGTPGDPTDSFSREMTEEELVARLGDEPGDIIVCGSSHEQFEGTIADVQIVSVGSVGEAPGGTHALGAIIDSTQAGFSATLFSVALQDDEEEWRVAPGP
jgi:predicted phosphodiesterase